MWVRRQKKLGTCKAARPPKKIRKLAKRWWLTPIILATQEAEITRITVQTSSDKQCVRPYLKKKKKKKITKKGWWRSSRWRP
jgi:hypothetical protein